MGKAYGICWAGQNDWIAPFVYAACAQISILCAFLMLTMCTRNVRSTTTNVKRTISNVRSAVSVPERLLTLFQLPRIVNVAANTQNCPAAKMRLRADLSAWFWGLICLEYSSVIAVRTAVAMRGDCST